MRSEGGQTFVWAIEDGKLVKRMVVIGRRDEESGRVEIKTALPGTLGCSAARFDNLKEGAPALVKGPDTGPPKASATAADGAPRASRRVRTPVPGCAATATRRRLRSPIPDD